MKYLILKITNRCNLNCIYCYVNNKDNKDMDFKTAKNAIDYLLSLDNKIKIQFTGGEPLLNFKLIEKVVDYCDNLNANISYAIQTNGTLITKKIAKRIKELDIKVGVSIDGLEINDILRPYKNRKSSTLDTLKGLYILKSYNIPFGITAVVTNKNLPYLEDFVKYLIAFGVKSISFDLLKPKKREYLNLMPDIKEFNKLLGKLKVYPIYIKNLQKRPKNKYCYLNSGDLLFVNEFGDIYLCPTLEGFLCLGNINKDKVKLPKIECNKCYAREFLIKNVKNI
ncbi:radical SAM protein [Methanocaldococcus fervens]|uniref:Radical SAM domain protein n=1 Tax=Methanocaldococcus fervens (strain DSM 4213 / JCM 15782 / AG86) TaxID=573064 RepID=C7P8X7_METFA|nr:radical SAM protein [Methanocaldococcus fervens]ACV25009.1 Radical SAM domain protein [Methanocaldococcus fervens AG86]